MRINNINSTQFKAIPISKIKVNGIEKPYKLYEITKKDNDFLEGLYDSINLKELMPGLNENDYCVWDGIIESAIQVTNKGGRKTLLETCDDKPCGLINYSKFCDKFHVNYIATFPTEPSKKVPFAGQILFNEVFKRLLDSCIDVIELKALRSSPFSPITKYSKLGFKPLGGTDYYERMKIYRSEIESAINMQEKFFTAEQEFSKRNIILDKFCKSKGLFTRFFLSLIR